MMICRPDQTQTREMSIRLTLIQGLACMYVIVIVLNIYFFCRSLIISFHMRKFMIFFISFLNLKFLIVNILQYTYRLMTTFTIFFQRNIRQGYNLLIKLYIYRAAISQPNSPKLKNIQTYYWSTRKETLSTTSTQHQQKQLTCNLFKIRKCGIFAK